MIELLWNAPVGEDRMTVMIDALELPEAAVVLDAGCGCGEVLRRVCERYEAFGTGVDVSADHVAEATRRADEAGVEDTVRFEQGDMQERSVEAGSLDLLLCLGSTHVFGLGADAFGNALRSAVSMLKPGGRLLIADGYLKRPASAAYRRMLGDATPDGTTHHANVQAGRRSGLVPLGAWTSSLAEWDDFEWGYQRIVEAKVRRNPDDAELAKRLSMRREWTDAYLAEGRETLGYGTYLFAVPEKTESAMT